MGKFIRRLLFSNFLASIVICASQSAPAEEVPGRLLPAGPNGKAPIWVSVHEAVGPDGRIDPTAFDEVLREGLERFASKQEQRRFEGKATSSDAPSQAREFAVDPSECDLSVMVVDESGEPFTPRDSLEDLVAHSRAAFSGRVVAVEQGFFRGSPSSLLKVRVDKKLLGGNGSSSGPFLFVRYPFAAFKIGDTVHCARDPRFPAGVRVGDLILVFSYTPPLDEGGSLIAPEAEMLLIENQQGKVVLPKRLQSDPALRGAPSLEAIKSMISDRVHSQEE